jgi:hypothetical protein
MQDKATKIGAQIQTEDGVSGAVEIINQTIS